MAHAFETLTPDVVLDALEGVGLRGDGRLTALSSYENRVYQVQLEDGTSVVAKFYRPERWSEAQILEEHAFAAELMAFEVPAIGPLVLNGQTLHQFGGKSMLFQNLRFAPALGAVKLGNHRGAVFQLYLVDAVLVAGKRR